MNETIGSRHRGHKLDGDGNCGGALRESANKHGAALASADECWLRPHWPRARSRTVFCLEVRQSSERDNSLVPGRGWL